MEQTKPEYHVVSLSGGKDSTAMLLMMLERGMRIDQFFSASRRFAFKLRFKPVVNVLFFLRVANGQNMRPAITTCAQDVISRSI